MTPTNTAFEIEPLTKTTGDGKVYTRRTEVLEQLEALLAGDPAEIERRVRIQKESEEDSIKSENLVFLIRKYFGTAMQDVISDTIAFRIRSIVGRHYWDIRRSNHHDAEDFLQDVLWKFIEKVFDFDSDAGQYAQVSFGDFVSGIGANEFRKYCKANDKTKIIDSIDEDIEAADGSTYGEEPEADFIDPLDGLITIQMLDRLPSDIRHACILKLEGWPVFSNDKDEVTISTIMGVSDRTIRYWFKKAARELAEHYPSIKERL